MAVYIIARFKIHDRELYDRYHDNFPHVFDQFNGKVLSIDENPIVLDGDWSDTRSVLIEFPDKPSAYAWMTSDAYREIAKDRVNASIGHSILVEGVEDED